MTVIGDLIEPLKGNGNVLLVPNAELNMALLSAALDALQEAGEAPIVFKDRSLYNLRIWPHQKSAALALPGFVGVADYVGSDDKEKHKKYMLSPYEIGMCESFRLIEIPV